MNHDTTVITGNTRPSSAKTPVEALTEFYFAFNHQDIEAMSDNWLNSAAVAMSNPLGDIKRGWNEIRPVYERIFNGTAKVYVEYYDFNIVQTESMFCAIGRERGWFRKDGTEVGLAIRTSRIFIVSGGRWKQVHHHGSIDDPGLLDRYQTAVKAG